MEIEIAPWSQTKWLVLSSFFFLIPGIYAYLQEIYISSFMLVCTSVISANYWRKCTHSWRRELDLVFAKISFLYFLYHSFLYLRNPIYITTGYPLLIPLYYLYNASGTLRDQKKDIWVMTHFVFHIILTYEEWIVIDSMIRN